MRSCPNYHAPMRCNVTFHGHVQGVGFRVTAKAIIDAQGLIGWVRNKPDGTVQMAVEGDDAGVSLVLDQIRERMGSNIRRTDVTECEDAGTETIFEIRH